MGIGMGTNLLHKVQDSKAYKLVVVEAMHGQSQEQLFT